MFTGSMMLPGLASFPNQDLPQLPADLVFMATNWGFKANLVDFCLAAKKDGYNGIEVWVPGSQNEMNALNDAVVNTGLKLGLLTGGYDSNPISHKKQFFEAIERAISMKPIYINCHSGRDHFEFEQNLEMLTYTIRRSEETGIPIYHETHRGRALFAAHVTKRFIDALEGLKLTLDISHWCNVHEGLLADQQNNVAAALGRAEHIHARIGHAEGPQVNDPRAPEWKNEVDAHMGWWDKIVARKRIEGKTITILTEFGPANYMQTLPFTAQPVADQWAINRYMMEILRKRYS